MYLAVLADASAKNIDRALSDNSKSSVAQLSSIVFLMLIYVPQTTSDSLSLKDKSRQKQTRKKKIQVISLFYENNANTTKTTNEFTNKLIHDIFLVEMSV